MRSISIALAACFVVVGASPTLAAQKTGTASTSKAAKTCDSHAKDAKCKTAVKPRSDTTVQKAPTPARKPPPQSNENDQSGSNAAS